MKVTEAKFTRRFRLAEYEHEEYTVSAIVEDKDSVEEVIGELKESVLAAFKGKAEETKTKEKKNGRTAKTRDADDEDSDEGAKSEGNESTDGESSDDDEAPDSEDSDNADGSPDDGEESDTDEKPKGKSKSAEKGAKKGKSEGSSGKKYRSKAQDYNRTIEQHKEIFSGVLKSVNPDWKKSEASKNKAKEISQKMEGKEFLDANGEVLESFTADVKKLMAGKSKK